MADRLIGGTSTADRLARGKKKSNRVETVRALVE
jgi:hypothetical protein